MIIIVSILIGEVVQVPRNEKHGNQEPDRNRVVLTFPPRAQTFLFEQYQRRPGLCLCLCLNNISLDQVCVTEKQHHDVAQTENVGI